MQQSLIQLLFLLQKGFEARGTHISDRLRTYERLLEDTISSLSQFAHKSSVDDHGIYQTGAPGSDIEQWSKDDRYSDEEELEDQLPVPNSADRDDTFFCDDPSKNQL